MVMDMATIVRGLCQRRRDVSEYNTTHWSDEAYKIHTATCDAMDGDMVVKNIQTNLMGKAGSTYGIKADGVSHSFEPDTLVFHTRFGTDIICNVTSVESQCHGTYDRNYDRPRYWFRVEEEVEV